MLVTVNMDSTEKKKLLVVGKSAHRRGFPRDFTTLPVQYESTKKAWMTGTLWDKILCQWNREFCLQSRKILLIVDNAPRHPEVTDLSNIRVEFLPENTTPFIQPIDAGIIKSIKGQSVM